MEIEKNSLSQQVQLLLVEALKVEPEMVTAELAFGDIPQWDSMGHMEVMMRLEEKFGVEINPDTIAALISVPEICTYIDQESE